MPVEPSSPTTKFLRGDKTWATPGGSGDVVGPSASVDSEVALYDGTTGKLLKRAAISGLAKLASGVLSAAVAGTDYAPSLGVSGGQTILGDTSGGGTLTLRGSSAGGKVNVPDLLGLRSANRPVVSFPFQEVVPVGTAQVAVGTGLANTATGTDSSDSTGLWQRVSGATAGLVNIRANPMLPAPGTVEFVIRTGSDIANQRIYLLLSANNGTAGDTQPNDSVGLAYRHAVDANNWEAVSRDGTTSATAADIAPIAANTIYVCRIRYDGTNYHMSVNGSAEVTMSSNLPTAATGMCICTSNSAGTHYLYWGVMARFFNWPT